MLEPGKLEQPAHDFVLESVMLQEDLDFETKMQYIGVYYGGGGAGGNRVATTTLQRPRPPRMRY